MIKLEKLGYLTTTEAADFLGIPRQSFYKLRDKELLPKPFLIQNGITIWRKKDIAKIKKTLGLA